MATNNNAYNAGMSAKIVHPTPKWVWLLMGSSALLAFALWRDGNSQRNPLPPWPGIGPVPSMILGYPWWAGPPVL